MVGFSKMADGVEMLKYPRKAGLFRETVSDRCIMIYQDRTEHAQPCTGQSLPQFRGQRRWQVGADHSEQQRDKTDVVCRMVLASLVAAHSKCLHSRHLAVVCIPVSTTTGPRYLRSAAHCHTTIPRVGATRITQFRHFWFAATDRS